MFDTGSYYIVALKSVQSPGCSQTSGDPPASTSRGLGSQALVTTLSLFLFFIAVGTEPRALDMPSKSCTTVTSWTSLWDCPGSTVASVSPGLFCYLFLGPCGVETRVFVHLLETHPALLGRERQGPALCGILLPVSVCTMDKALEGLIPRGQRGFS